MITVKTHLNSPSVTVEESKLRDKEVSKKKKKVGCCLCRIWYRDWRGRGGTVYVNGKKSFNTGGGRRQLAIGYQRWQDLKVTLLRTYC
jgi:hypothetical protein